MKDRNRYLPEVIGLGMFIAAKVSWFNWHSIGWAIFHFLLGWVYVVYYVFQYGIKW